MLRKWDMVLTKTSAAVEIHGGNTEANEAIVGIHNFRLQLLAELALVVVDVLVHEDARQPVLDLKKGGLIWLSILVRFLATCSG